MYLHPLATAGQGGSVAGHLQYGELVIQLADGGLQIVAVVPVLADGRAGLRGGKLARQLGDLDAGGMAQPQ